MTMATVASDHDSSTRLKGRSSPCHTVPCWPMTYCASRNGPVQYAIEPATMDDAYQAESHQRQPPCRNRASLASASVDRDNFCKVIAENQTKIEIDRHGAAQHDPR